jgi:nucleoside-diphosphate-sugar epimerase
MKILVTGGSGFLGKHILILLLEQGNKVINVDVIGSGLYHSDLTEHLIDVNNLKSFFDADIVIHCAAMVPSSKKSKTMYSVNINGTRNLLNLALEFKIKKFVFISSSAVYGIPRTNPISIKSPKIPFEIYGKSKLMAEEICKDYMKLGVPITIVRPRTILGYSRSGLFSLIFFLVQNGKKIPVIANGQNLYQFIDVDDLTNLISKVLKIQSNLDINVGGKGVYSIRDTLDGLIAYTNSNSTLINIPNPILQLIALLSKLQFLPFAPYQLKMYGESMWFDINDIDKSIEWKPQFNSIESIIKSYETFISLKKGDQTPESQLSIHSKPLTSVLLRLILKILP